MPKPISHFDPFGFGIEAQEVQEVQDEESEEFDEEYLAAENEAKAFLYDLIKSGVDISSNKDLNRYILNHGQLKRYPHLLGYLEMSNSSDNWTYKGGISPRWYKFICEELNLSKNKSNAKAKKFTPYSQAIKDRTEFD